MVGKSRGNKQVDKNAAKEKSTDSKRPQITRLAAIGPNKRISSPFFYFRDDVNQAKFQFQKLNSIPTDSNRLIDGLINGDIMTMQVILLNLIRIHEKSKQSDPHLLSQLPVG